MSTQNFALYPPQIIVPSSPMDLDDSYGSLPYVGYYAYDKVPRLDGWGDASYDAISGLVNDQFWAVETFPAPTPQPGSFKQYMNYHPSNSKQPRINRINTKLRTAILRNRAQDYSGHASAALSELLTADPLNYYSPASTAGAPLPDGSVTRWDDSLSVDTMSYSASGSPYPETLYPGRAGERPHLSFAERATMAAPDHHALPPIEQIDGKQPCYREMLRFALNSHPEGRMPLSELYLWITTNYPNFVNKVAKWKNCVRHALAREGTSHGGPRLFDHEPRPIDRPGRGDLWFVVGGTSKSQAGSSNTQSPKTEAVKKERPSSVRRQPYVKDAKAKRDPAASRADSAIRHSSPSVKRENRPTPHLANAPTVPSSPDHSTYTPAVSSLTPPAAPVPQPNAYSFDARTVSSLEEAIYAGFADETSLPETAPATAQQNSAHDCTAWLADQYLFNQ
ncbi:Forkhead box protein J2 [Geranomyces variabilis]|uniref:Forkhead box protein J2 n=1 Tax=Geranomyces variabilis TaxID=109894 RepID=A0AAD5TKX0_9FUNG|nr:Forkhead box protein J2 [Geranomyces variabilis]